MAVPLTLQRPRTNSNLTLFMPTRTQPFCAAALRACGLEIGKAIVVHARAVVHRKLQDKFFSRVYHVGLQHLCTSWPNL